MFSFIVAGALFASAVVATPVSQGSSSTIVCGGTSITDHLVESGQTLTTIKERYNSGICDIASLNGLASPNAVDAGVVIRVPVDCQTPDDTSCINSPTTPTFNATCAIGVATSYRVISGDTLTAIAANFAISLDGLQDVNSQIEDFNLISIGQLINIPVCPGTQCRIKTYTIESGDVFFDLAQEFNTTVGQIQGLNQAANATALEIGQQIVVPCSCKQVKA